MIAFHLTASAAAAAALKAHSENRLTAQHGDGCVFWDPATGHCCALGAGMPSVLIAYLDQLGQLDTGVDWLIEDAKLLTTDDRDALHWLMACHDEWHDAEVDALSTPTPVMVRRAAARQAVFVASARGLAE